MKGVTGSPRGDEIMHHEEWTETESYQHTIPGKAYQVEEECTVTVPGSSYSARDPYKDT